jgi:hypothetical protein
MTHAAPPPPAQKDQAGFTPRFLSQKQTTQDCSPEHTPMALTNREEQGPDMGYHAPTTPHTTIPAMAGRRSPRRPQQRRSRGSSGAPFA